MGKRFLSKILKIGIVGDFSYLGQAVKVSFASLTPICSNAVIQVSSWSQSVPKEFFYSASLHVKRNTCMGKF